VNTFKISVKKFVNAVWGKELLRVLLLKCSVQIVTSEIEGVINVFSVLYVTASYDREQ